ncbi:MAG: flagellar protein FlgN [Spirochaetota bacterium]
MSENIVQLESVLSEELLLFTSILRLEKEKSDAIIKKNGHLMQTLSREQEENVSKINSIEKARKKLTSHYLKDNSIEKITLTDIASIEGIPDGTIAQIGALLKKTITKIRALQETNAKMINDNLEYFKKMIKEVKNSVSMETGYSEKGMENAKTVNSFILDKKI